ncbi:Coiled-coil domain-containing protein, partial [Helicobacter pylori]
HKKRLEHIQKNQGKIKLKEYQQINPYREFLQHDRE